VSQVRRRKQPTATLFVQIFALVVLSLVIAQAVNAWAIFHLPRPSPEFYTTAEIIDGLRRGPGDFKTGPRGLIVRRDSAPVRGHLEVARGPRRVRMEIAEALGPMRWESVLQVRRQMEREGREAPFLISPFQVAVRQPQGDWLLAHPPRSSMLGPWQARMILWFLITAAAMAPVAWLFARRLSSSVALFATAAERLGRDPNAPALQVKGPSEIMPAVAAFNEMQERLRRYVADRTSMAAAMAHDLRTPLTRLRFRVESAPQEVRGKMAADIDEMEAMIAAALAYVRDAQGATERTPLELSSLLESVVDDLAETGAKVSIDRADRVVIDGDPMGLRRMLVNLIENACKFGGGARSRLFSEDGFAVFQVEDDGPGIPEGELEKVFEPFYRGEPSRSRETGGSGLGLAAVRSIARIHGGDARLHNRSSGGVTAEVRLPLRALH
jgi:two-component system, OmpR family, sensor kinase